jgi:hypothetical protein
LFWNRRNLRNTVRTLPLEAILECHSGRNQQLRIAPFQQLLAVSASRRVVEPGRTYLADHPLGVSSFPA